MNTSAYLDDFIYRADPYDWGIEPVSIPRVRWEGEKCIRHKYDGEEIKQGYVLNFSKRRVAYSKQEPIYFPDDDGNDVEAVKDRIKQTTFNTLRHHLQLKKTDRKKWLFTTYNDMMGQSFVQFDVDFRDASKWDEFQDRIDAIASHNIPVIWTTSPGDIIDGQHLQGRYAWIKLDKGYDPAVIGSTIDKWLVYNGIQTDHGNDKPKHLIRLPGQKHVGVCEPFTGRVLHPICHHVGDFKTWEHFAEQWENLEAVPLSIFEVDDGDMPAAEAVVVLPSLTVASAAEGNAFRRLVGTPGKRDGLIFRHVCRYRSKELALASRDGICQQVWVDFEARCISGEYDGHVGANAPRGRALVARAVDWFLRHFDPKKCHRIQRNIDDVERFSPYGSVNSHDLIRRTELSYKDKGVFLRILDAMKKYNGRLAAKTIYWVEKKLCSLSQWLRIRKYLKVLSPFSKEHKVCTQYGINDELMRKTRERVYLRQVETDCDDNMMSLFDDPIITPEVVLDPYSDECGRSMDNLLRRCSVLPEGGVV